MSHVKLEACDESILTAIVALSHFMPDGPVRRAATEELSRSLPLPLREYGKAIARIRYQKFKIRGRSRGEITRGYIQGRNVRVTDKWK